MASSPAPVLGAAERRRLAPLAAALVRARQPGPPRLEPVVGALVPGGGHGGALRQPPAALFAGSFNPLTRAHAALAVAGHRAGCDPVVLTMAPVSLAKEGVERAHPLDRLDWLCRWARPHPWAVVALASHPLLVDQAEALAEALYPSGSPAAAMESAGGPSGRGTMPPEPPGGAPVALLLGSDKAAQLAEPHWYDDLDAALKRLGQAASLLVAERAGHPAPTAPGLPVPVTALPLPAWAPERSSTEARAAAAAGRPLDRLVPARLARAIARSAAYNQDPASYQARAALLDALIAQVS